MLSLLRKPAAYILTAIMILSALLHLYWALGGTWFLETALNMRATAIPPIIYAITWLLVVAMLVVSAVALARIEVIFKRFPDPISAFVFWAFSGFMLFGAAFNFLIPRFWDRWVFAPVFLFLAILGIVLALPPKRLD